MPELVTISMNLMHVEKQQTQDFLIFDHIQEGVGPLFVFLREGFLLRYNDHSIKDLAKKLLKCLR
ncbi:hypothetical protein GCM10027035_18680 [Emticicia sediminis]